MDLHRRWGTDPTRYNLLVFQSGRQVWHTSRLTVEVLLPTWGLEPISIVPGLIAYWTKAGAYLYGPTVGGRGVLTRERVMRSLCIAASVWTSLHLAGNEGGVSGSAFFDGVGRSQTRIV